jgi:hypothetical protein
LEQKKSPNIKLRNMCPKQISKQHWGFFNLRTHSIDLFFHDYNIVHLQKLGDEFFWKCNFHYNLIRENYNVRGCTSRNQPKCNQSIYDYMRLVGICN